MTHPLAEYLAAAGDTAPAFAGRIGVRAATLSRILAGRGAEINVARRIVDATDGAVLLSDLCGEPLADFVARREDDGPIDQAALGVAIEKVLAEVAASPMPDGLAGLAAEAVADTHAALARVTSRRGADRLVQALAPVLAEILRDWPGGPVPGFAPLETAQLASRLYFQDPRR